MPASARELFTSLFGLFAQLLYFIYALRVDCRVCSPKSAIFHTFNPPTLSSLLPAVAPCFNNSSRRLFNSPPNSGNLVCNLSNLIPAISSSRGNETVLPLLPLVDDEEVSDDVEVEVSSPTF